MNTEEETIQSEVLEQVEIPEEEIITEPTEELSEPESPEELDLEEELILITEEFPECKMSKEELSKNERYSTLRSLGLTVREAYLATRPKEAARDNRSHLTAAIPRSAAAPQNQMSRQQLDMARSLFSDLDDNEIRRLYKKVTK